MINLSKKLLITILITFIFIGSVNPVFADENEINLPDGYIRLDYIQSSGSQYIDTGINLTSISNLKIEADAQFMNIDTSSSKLIFGTGTYNSNSGNRRLFGIGIWSSQSQGFRAINNTTAANGIYISNSLDTNRHIFKIDLSNNSASLDNSSVNFQNNGNQSSASLIIFGGRNIAQSSLPVYYLSSIKLYSFKIYSNIDLIYNFVPCLNENGVAGLYDVVNEQFYSNNGTGTFITTTIYTITTNVTPAGSGTVTGGGNYPDGYQVMLTAIPNQGYHFVEWSNGNQANPYSFIAFEGLNITAIFAPNTISYTLTTLVDPVGSGIVIGGGSYESGSNVQIEAIPENGYIFDHWSDSNTLNPRYVYLNGDTTLTAYFIEEENEYDIVLSVYPEGSGTVTGDGTYEAGSEITIEAIPDDGFEFISWSDGNSANPRTITVDRNINLIASFRQIQEDIPDVDNDQIILIILLITMLIFINLGKGVFND